MKILKKNMSIILAFILILNFSLVAEAQDNSKTFSDVKQYWATESIYWAVKEGLVSGYEDGSFKPQNNLTEAEFAVMLASFCNNIDTKSLEKIPGAHWSQHIYNELKRYDLPLKGYSDDSIKNKPITRGQVAQIIAAKNGFNLTYPQSVEYMYGNGLSNGKLPNIKTFESYGANDPLKRDEAAAFFKTLSNSEFTYFRGTKSKAEGSNMIGIVNVSPIIDKDPTISNFANIKISRADGIEVPEWAPITAHGATLESHKIDNRYKTIPTSTLTYRFITYLFPTENKEEFLSVFEPSLRKKLSEESVDRIVEFINKYFEKQEYAEDNFKEGDIDIQVYASTSGHHGTSELTSDGRSICIRIFSSRELTDADKSNITLIRGYTVPVWVDAESYITRHGHATLLAIALDPREGRKDEFVSVFEPSIRKNLPKDVCDTIMKYIHDNYEFPPRAERIELKGKGYHIELSISMGRISICFNDTK